MDIVLISSNGDKYHLPKNVASLSELVRTMTDNDMNESEEELEVPLLNVTSPTLEKIIQFLNYYHEHPFPEIQKPLQGSIKDLVGEWYANYVDIKEDELFELINASNYMDISPLLHLGCATVASQIRGKTPEEIRTLFNINNNIAEDTQNISSGCNDLTIEDVTNESTDI